VITGRDHVKRPAIRELRRILFDEDPIKAAEDG
jgi:hypothetical protein